MHARNIHPLLILLFVGGCASEPFLLKPTTDHPASAAAKEGARPVFTETLVIDQESSPATSLPSGHEHGAPGKPDGVAPQKGGESKPAEPGKEKAAFSCPMHPEVVSAHPGKCPKCGMNLREAPKDEEDRDH